MKKCEVGGTGGSGRRRGEQKEKKKVNPFDCSSYSASNIRESVINIRIGWSSSPENTNKINRLKARKGLRKRIKISEITFENKRRDQVMPVKVATNVL